MLNLDEYTSDQLNDFIQKVEFDVQNFAKELFPNKEPGFVKAALALGRYAKSRLDMLSDLSKNRYERASKHEEKMNQAFRAIPEFAQW